MFLYVLYMYFISELYEWVDVWMIIWFFGVGVDEVKDKNYFWLCELILKLWSLLCFWNILDFCGKVKVIIKVNINCNNSSYWGCKFCERVVY